MCQKSLNSRYSYANLNPTNEAQICSGDQFDRRENTASSLAQHLIPPDLSFFFVSMRDTKVRTLVEDESCQSERVFPGTASSPASVSRGPRMTDGSQRSHVLNPVCRWTPVVVLNPAPGGSRESAERPIHPHADTVSHVGQLEGFLHCEPPP